MFITFVGVNEKIINLNTISLIEDESTEDESVAVVTTSDGAEIRLTGDDADALFTRADELIALTNQAITQLNHLGNAQQ